jgi:hypothetical protein
MSKALLSLYASGFVFSLKWLLKDLIFMLFLLVIEGVKMPKKLAFYYDVRNKIIVENEIFLGFRCTKIVKYRKLVF